MRIECKKTGKIVELNDGIIPDEKLAELQQMIKKNRKHGIFAWSK